MLILLVSPGDDPPVLRAEPAQASVILTSEQATELARALLAGTLQAGSVYGGEAEDLTILYTEDDQDED